MTGPVDYAAVVADLEKRRAEIEAALRFARSMSGAPVPARDDDDEAGGESAPPGGNTPIQGVRNDTFFRLSTSEAIVKYLNIAKRTKTIRTIADALHAGGQVHARTPESAYTNTLSALKRGKKSGVFTQTPDKQWGLAEWYGNNKPTKGEKE